MKRCSVVAVVVDMRCLRWRSRRHRYDMRVGKMAFILWGMKDKTLVVSSVDSCNRLLMKCLCLITAKFKGALGARLAW